MKRYKFNRLCLDFYLLLCTCLGVIQEQTLKYPWWDHKIYPIAPSLYFCLYLALWASVFLMPTVVVITWFTVLWWKLKITNVKYLAKCLAGSRHYYLFYYLVLAFYIWYIFSSLAFPICLNPLLLLLLHGMTLGYIKRAVRNVKRLRTCF